MGFFLLYKSKTSLKKKVVNGEYCFRFDNLFYDAAVLKINKHDVILFTNNSTSLEKKRTISDHIPI
jgi:hypothetical protein